MKLVLCSEGLSTPNIRNEFVNLCGKPKEQISFAVINEAYAVDGGDKRWVLNNLNTAATFGGELDLINLLALPIDEVRGRIETKDAIFVVGGHTDYLMSVFAKSGFDKILPDMLKTKVYVGSSAGSMVVGQRLSEKAYLQIYNERNTYSTTRYLGFVDFAIMPHLDSPYFPLRKENLQTASKEHNGLVYGLRDDTAIIVDGDKTYTVGSEPYKLGSV